MVPEYRGFQMPMRGLYNTVIHETAETACSFTTIADTKLNNVMLRVCDRTPLCVMGLDTTMPGLSAYDFGDTIRLGASTIRSRIWTAASLSSSWLRTWKKSGKKWLKSWKTAATKKKKHLKRGAFCKLHAAFRQVVLKGIPDRRCQNHGNTPEQSRSRWRGGKRRIQCCSARRNLSRFVGPLWKDHERWGSSHGTAAQFFLIPKKIHCAYLSNTAC